MPIECFTDSEDQQAVLDAVAQVAVRHQLPVLDGHARFEPRADLEHDLEAGGYFEAVLTDGLGPVLAAAVVMQLAALSVCAEVAASALLAPLLGLPRPCAVLQGSRDAPTRFVMQARSVIALDDDAVWHTPLADGDAQAVDSLFGYPMGRLARPAAMPWQRAEIEPRRALDLCRVALAAEITGQLGAALHSVVEPVSQRRQFGRPLGSLQAVRPLCHDLHQFMGAMGLTLEHPLHRWTYRARRLQSELDGAERQFVQAAKVA